MSKKPRSNDELIAASYHLAYEIEMMRGCAVCLSQIPQPPPHAIIFNALLNSFLMHVRNIVEFLYTESGKATNDQVIAEDYFRGNFEEWRMIRPEKTELLRETHVALQQAAAHLSYRRITRHPFWGWNDVGRDLELIMNEFVKNVPVNRIHDDLRNLFD